MDISDEDADEILTALSIQGFRMPHRISILTEVASTQAQIDIARTANRNAVKLALESTQAWGRYRIY